MNSAHYVVALYVRAGGVELKNMNELSVTHQLLVFHAAKWLAKKCGVVITELSTMGEIPDAIGWQGAHSILIECKASRSDFAADANKSFRANPWSGIGVDRYYLVPCGLIAVEELPPGWGLLELTEKGVRVVKKPNAFSEVNTRQEIRLLLSAIRRIGATSPKGVSVKFYTIESSNTATLGVCLEEPVAT